MRNFTAVPPVWLAATLLSLGALARPCAADKPAGRALYAGDELLKDYDPRPTLVAKVTRVSRPKFPVTDVHCHWGFEQDPQKLLAAMDDLGVSRAVNLSGGFGPALDRMLARYHKAAPDRLLIFANLDFKQIDDPAFGTKMADYLKDARAKGASGLKIFKNFGLSIKDASGSVVPIDDPRLDPVWDRCGELAMPVLIHAADPPAFFQPIDRFNERWLQLKRHPDWAFDGPQFPKYAQILAQHVRIIQRHPHTVFISAHLANSGDDLRQLAQWLDACPNLYVDLSGRIEELGRQPYSARKFLIRYADRILFGTDRYPGRRDQPRNAIYYRFLETDDEYFDYYDHPFPPEGDWKIYGMYLPDDVLEKIYHGNADRALAGKLPQMDTDKHR